MKKLSNLILVVLLNGTHPTTKLALQALETVVRGGETRIDVGTGSGVLSIAAAYFGVEQIKPLMMLMLKRSKRPKKIWR